MKQKEALSMETNNNILFIIVSILIYLFYPFFFLCCVSFHFSTFNFSVPELSWLAALLLFAVMIVLHFIPIRVLLMAWGIIKFSKRIIRPHAVTNNEVLDFLSRVPDDEELVSYLTTHPFSIFSI